MENDNLVSIIIPVFNASKHIAKTVESINVQTYCNYEAIFIDDFSTDSSVQIIEKYLKDNSRFKLIKLKRHKGVSIARNIGIKKSNGRYLAFLDADDIWLKNKLEKQVRFLKENNYEFIYSSFKYMDEKGTKLSKNVKVPIKTNYEQSLLDTRILISTVVLDLNGIPKRYCYMPNVMHEDIVTWWKILKKGYNAYSQKDVLVQYRKTKNSRSSKKLLSAKYRWKAYRQIEKLSFIRSVYCFINYIINAIIKRWTNFT